MDKKELMVLWRNHSGQAMMTQGVISEVVQRRKQQLRNNVIK